MSATPHQLGSWFAIARYSRRREALGATSLLLVLLPFGLLLLLVENRWSPLAELDAAARDSLHGFAIGHPWFVRTMLTLSDLGSGGVWTSAAILTVAVLLWRRRGRTALFVAVTAIGSPLLNRTVKQLVHRARPVLAAPVDRVGGFSFPSGHAQSAMVGYALLLILVVPTLGPVWRRVAVLLAVLMVMGIGFSRVALGVHYVSDVLAGYVLGAAWVAAVAAVLAVRRGSDRLPRAAERLR